ncbi:MAG: Mu-like prophage major head subunit gpT family protein [Planctomycetota bacterium]
MAVISTGLLTKGLRSEFFNRLTATPSVYLDLATRIVSNSDRETYKWLGTVPVMREWGTGRVAHGLRSESYSIENLKYESTIEVDRDELSDDQTGQIRIRIQEMAVRAATHKDKLVADLLANGGGAGYLAYDGSTFFATDHESGDSGAQSNKLEFDISAVMTAEPNTPDAPSIATCKKAFSTALAAMMQFKDDQGEPMDISASSLVVACHPAVYETWLTALTAGMISNTDNVLRQFSTRVLPMGRLSDVSEWFLLKTDGVVRPFVFQDREPIEFSQLVGDSEEGFKREKYLYGVRARYRLTYGYWQYAVRTDFV